MKTKIERKFRTYDRRSMGLEIQKQSEMILAMGEQVDALQAVLRQNAKTNKETIEAQQREIDELKRQRDLWQTAATNYSGRMLRIQQIAAAARELAFNEANKPWWQQQCRAALRDTVVTFQNIIQVGEGKEVAVRSSLKRPEAKG